MKLKSCVVGAVLLSLSAMATAGESHFDLPPVEAQKLAWDCGPNAAIRVLLYHDLPITMDEMLAGCPKTVDLDIKAEIVKAAPIAAPFVNALNIAKLEIGPSPYQLADYMNSIVERANRQIRNELRNSSAEELAAALKTVTYRVYSPESLREITGFLDRKQPVMLLVKKRLDAQNEEQNQPAWGIFPMAAMVLGKSVPDIVNGFPFVQQEGLNFTAEQIPNQLTTPLLHYVVVTGYMEFEDEAGKTDILFDVVDPATAQTEMVSLESLETEWNWTANSAFIRTLFQAKRVSGKTMIIPTFDAFANVGGNNSNNGPENGKPGSDSNGKDSQDKKSGYVSWNHSKILTN